MLVLLLTTALTIPASADFKQRQEFKTHTVERAQVASLPNPWIRSTDTIPVPAKDIYNALTQYKNYQTLFGEHVESVKILAESSASTKLHIVWPLPWPMSDRDAVVAYEHKMIKEGHFEIHWQDAFQKGDPNTALRIEQVQGRTTITEQNGKTTIEYVYYGDLGGDLPDWVKEKAWDGEPLTYFNAIRKQFKLDPIKED